ncbi:MAG TPA: hypothetical protein ENG01_01105 [Candidatus Aenigmarchaeota archaeon]|nr:hypothetical protein [Candidatus Aenigmarchaeota archaeon]HEX32994.1 hypothetical protein [Candidatus Aenigmarchaeota archaeon]
MDKIYIILFVLLFIVTVYAVFQIQQYNTANYIEKREKQCDMLAEDLTQLTHNYTHCMQVYNDESICSNTTPYNVSCDFANCLTGRKEIDSRTQPGCACNFTGENISLSLCIRVV